MLGIYELFPANWLTNGAMKLVCGAIPDLCKFGIYLLAEEDMTIIDTERSQVYLSHFPSGTSTKGLQHYGQMYKAKQFQRYDYGKSSNMLLYD